jgi:tRNA/tmRNA/rRNA uracil-C5-methylase (TrmA/RlmC/RlmD family)
MVDSFIDAAGRAAPENFRQMDLYDERSLYNFTRRADTPRFDTILLDPPRRGFPALDAWLGKIRPRQLVYVSCNPASLARDLRSLTAGYRVRSLQLLDLFPATAHFETLVALEFTS